MPFVKCHYWAFDGEKAMATCQRKKERWDDATTECTGINFGCYICAITFNNNPFSYSYMKKIFY
jgi:hypothetical protein